MSEIEQCFGFLYGNLQSVYRKFVIIDLGVPDTTSVQYNIGQMVRGPFQHPTPMGDDGQVLTSGIAEYIRQRTDKGKRRG